MIRLLFRFDAGATRARWIALSLSLFSLLIRVELHAVAEGVRGNVLYSDSFFVCEVVITYTTVIVAHIDTVYSSPYGYPTPNYTQLAPHKRRTSAPSRNGIPTVVLRRGESCKFTSR